MELWIPIFMSLAIEVVHNMAPITVGKAVEGSSKLAVKVALRDLESRPSK